MVGRNTDNDAAHEGRLHIDGLHATANMLLFVQGEIHMEDIARAKPSFDPKPDSLLTDVHHLARQGP